MSSFHSLIKQVDKSLNKILIILLTLIVVDVLWQVITRFILNSPSSFTEEVARFLLIWLSLFGAASAYYNGLHLGIDVLVKKFGSVAQLMLELVVSVMVLAFSIMVLIIGGGKLMLLTLELNQTSAVLGVKIGYIYLAMPLSGILFSLFSVNFMLLTFARLKDLRSDQIKPA